MPPNRKKKVDAAPAALFVGSDDEDPLAMTPVRGSTSRIQHKASSSSKSRSSRQHVPSEDSEDHMEVGRKEETHPRRKISIAGAGEGRRRKSRRIARTHGIDPGPSGWRRFGSSSDGDDDGVDERDLIPPSDDEEYEAWKAMRKQKSSRRARSEASEVGAEVSSQRQRPSEVDAVNHREVDSRQETPSPEMSSYNSHSTSPTIPLSFDDYISRNSTYNGGFARGTQWAEEEDDEDDSAMSVEELDESQASDVGRTGWPGLIGSSPFRAATTPLRAVSQQSPLRPAHATTPSIVAEANPASGVDQDPPNPSPPLELSPNPALSTPNLPPPSLVLPQISSSAEHAQVVTPRKPTHPRIQSLTPNRAPVIASPSPALSPFLTPATPHSTSSLVEGQGGLYHQPPARPPTQSPVNQDTPTRSAPALSPFAYEPGSNGNSGGHSVSPLAYSQNGRLPTPPPFPLDFSSPAHRSVGNQPTPSNRSIGNGFNGSPPDRSRPSTEPSPMYGGALEQSQPATGRQSPLSPPPSSPATSHRPPPVSSPPAESEPRPPADIALENFRTTRTFRTRTKLQLQPYTKERQHYEAILRRGGLTRGQMAIAESAEIPRAEKERGAEPEAEAQGDSSEEEYEADPERIVIGSSPPLRVRQPRKLEDADYDDYLLEYGVWAGDDDEELAAGRLQKIARQRIRKEKEERKRKRDADKSRREFERMLKERPAENRMSSDDEIQLHKGPIKPSKSTTKPTAKKVIGGVTTYGKKTRPATDAKRLSSPAQNRRRDTETPGRPPPPPRRPSLSPDFGNTAAPGGQYGDDFNFDQGFDDSPYDGGLFDQGPVDNGFFDNSPVNNRLPDRGPIDLTMSSPRSPINPPRSPVINPVQSDSEDDTTASESGGSSGVADKREKIARRVLPGVMFKLDKQEAIEREKRKQEKKRRNARQVDIPTGPGRAVVRKAQVEGDLHDMVQMLASEDDESDRSQSIGRRSPSVPPPRQRELIIISDDSSSDGSQAEEDNFAEETLARLYDGDFETIIAGRRALPRKDKKAGNAKATKPRKRGEARHRRPALGLNDRERRPAPMSSDARTMVQNRLDFPAAARTPTSTKHRSKATSGKKRKHPAQQQQTKRSRPAIHLDDHVIFATADFAFDEPENSIEELTPRPKAKSRSSITPRKRIELEHIDEGIGKARSWANFDKIPVDFGITPLPSGLECDPDSYVGSGALLRLVQHLKGNPQPRRLEPCFAHGVELQPGMPADDVVPVLSVLFDGLQADIKTFASGVTTISPSVEFLDFLGAYCSSPAGSTSTSLQDELESLIPPLLVTLDSLDSSIYKAKAPLRAAILDTRLHLLDLTSRLESRVTTSQIGISTQIITGATGLICQLLRIGFDKAIKPLKAILRAESDTALIEEVSTISWIAVCHILKAWDNRSTVPESDTFSTCLSEALDTVYYLDRAGPIASERIWLLVFGLGALSQFGPSGRISMIFTPAPQWQLARRAISLIKISHNEEAEEAARTELLQGRDRYLKTILARCIKLSSVWKWNFDRKNFSVATKDLGVIFKDRQHRNLPTEPPVEYPNFITRFDIALTANEETKGESAFELYLRLVCVGAADIIGSAESLIEAQQAEKDVQRLIMSIIPVSPVKFNRILPPTMRQLGQLINRYSTMIAACFFSPSLLPWLLANSKKWAPFEMADFESRQVSIRGLMYLAVACRHHGHPLDMVVNRLADFLAVLQSELDTTSAPGPPAVLAGRGPSRVEIERTMVLIVACFRQIILHHTFDVEQQKNAVYPDPSLLHECWTARVFDLDLANDLKCGTEIVSTIQTFLDTRSAALPRLARQRREARECKVESQDEYSFGIDLSTIDLAALGAGGGDVVDPVQAQDEKFGHIINQIISPKIYKLLSGMLPQVVDPTMSEKESADRQVFIGRLTKCWSDCAGVVVVEQNSLDGWTPYIGTFGKESWQRTANDRGRLQVGLHFMSNVAKLDPGCFDMYQEEFVTLFFQVIATDRLTIEHKFVSALFAMSNTFSHPFFTDVPNVQGVQQDMDRSGFMDLRIPILEAIYSTIPTLLSSSRTASRIKSLVYRCMNLLISSIASNEKSISAHRIIHKESYHAFAMTTINDLTRLAGDYITVNSVPSLKAYI